MNDLMNEILCDADDVGVWFSRPNGGWFYGQRGVLLTYGEAGLFGPYGSRSEAAARAVDAFKLKPDAITLAALGEPPVSALVEIVADTARAA